MSVHIHPIYFTLGNKSDQVSFYRKHNLKCGIIKHMHKDVPLADYSTMRLGGPAKFLQSITEAGEIPTALAWAKKQGVPVIMIGGGSNIVWKDSGFDGLVLVNKIKGFSIQPADAESSYVEIRAGEDWDKVVARTVKAGLHGIEALSLIPGTAGATPVQNVGAYGQEIAHTLVSVQAYDSDGDAIAGLSDTIKVNFTGVSGSPVGSLRMALDALCRSVAPRRQARAVL